LTSHAKSAEPFCVLKLMYVQRSLSPGVNASFCLYNLV